MTYENGTFHDTDRVAEQREIDPLIIEDLWQSEGPSVDNRSTDSANRYLPDVRTEETYEAASEICPGSSDVTLAGTANGPTLSDRMVRHFSTQFEEAFADRDFPKAYRILLGWVTLRTLNTQDSRNHPIGLRERLAYSHNLGQAAVNAAKAEQNPESKAEWHRIAELNLKQTVTLQDAHLPRASTGLKRAHAHVLLALNYSEMNRHQDANESVGKIVSAMRDAETDKPTSVGVLELIDRYIAVIDLVNLSKSVPPEIRRSNQRYHDELALRQDVMKKRIALAKR